MIRNHGMTENSSPAICAGLPSMASTATSAASEPPQTTIAASRSRRMPPITITK